MIKIGTLFVWKRLSLLTFFAVSQEAARGAGWIMDKCSRGDGDCDERESCLG